MKTNIVYRAVSGLGAFIGLTVLAAAADCDSVGAQVRSEIAEKPSRVLVIVDEAISQNESCACEVVKAAIEAADAYENAVLVREIVVTAVTAAEGMAATIAECAVAVSPSSAAEIKGGLSEVFEGAKAGAKDAYYSSKGAKEVVEIEEDEEFRGEQVVISGVYLIAPVAPSASSTQQLIESERAKAAKLQKNLIELLRRQQRLGRKSGDTRTSRPRQS